MEVWETIKADPLVGARMLIAEYGDRLYAVALILEQENHSAEDLVSRTVRKFRDFDFKFEFSLTPNANSGVKYFYDETKNKGTCEEYQLLDEGHPDWRQGRDGNRRVAALYDLVPAQTDGLRKKPGEWNQGRIISKGSHVEHWLNGVKVLEYERGSKAFRQAVDKSKYAKWGTGGNRWGELPEGRILLQDHTDSTVSFRSLKIREL